jgi:hypothetical protein
MNEQIGHQYRRTKNGQQVIQRRTSSQDYQQSSNPHRVGHQAGLHPEDYPYITTGQTPVIRQRYATSGRGNIEDELEEGDEFYETRLPTSARRYNAPQDGQVIRAGNKRIIVHYEEPPPVRRRRILKEQHEKPRSGFHWLFIVGLVLLIGIAGFAILNTLSSLWQQKQDDWTYGFSPRTYQTDAVVGHSDSSTNPSHFFAFNLKGQITVIELPGGDASKARSYQITVIPDNQGNPPVKVVFQDLNHDGKLDMLVEIGDPGSFVTVMLFNNGTQFVSKL